MIFLFSAVVAQTLLFKICDTMWYLLWARVENRSVNALKLFYIFIAVRLLDSPARRSGWISLLTVGKEIGNDAVGQGVGMRRDRPA